MKGKYLPFLILPFFIFSFFSLNSLSVFAQVEEEEVTQEDGWIDTSACVAEACGTTEGTKMQTYYEWVCEKTCPTVEFSASEEYIETPGYYERCPLGYEQLEGENKCVQNETRYAFKGWVQTGRYSWQGHWVCPEDENMYTEERYYWSISSWDWKEKPCSREFVIDTIDMVYVDPVYATKTYGPISVKYLLDIQSGICARPSADDVIEGTCNSWAEEYYNSQMPITMDVVDTDTCELVATNTRTVDCEAEVVECPAEESVLGVEDQVEVEEVGVVLAETGATSNILVYVIQAILTLSTIFSGIFFSKKYIM